jgi:hypothetical protein
VTERRSTEHCEAMRGHAVTVELDGFAWEALESEAGSEGVGVEELVTFSVLYYLADIDSGRLARRISSSPHAQDHSKDHL